MSKEEYEPALQASRGEAFGAGGTAPAMTRRCGKSWPGGTSECLSVAAREAFGVAVGARAWEREDRPQDEGPGIPK